MVNNPYNLLGYALHVLQKLFELSHKLSLSWLKCHSLSLRIIIYSCLNTVLLLLLAHFSEDEVCTLLIDLDLGLNHHVVHKPDESAQTMIVSLSQLENSVFQFIFLLLQHH